MKTNISKKLPAYIPTREALLLVWIEQFLNGLKPMIALFQIEQQDYDILVEDFATIQDIYKCHVNSHGVATADREYKDLSLYDRNQQMATAPRTEEKIFPADSNFKGGYVWRLVNLINTQILPSSNYSEDIGRQLHIIAAATQPTDWSTVQPVLEAVNDEAGVHLSWGKGDAEGVLLEVNRNDSKGWQFLNVVSRASYTDRAQQPQVSTVWKYRATYRYNEETVGKVSAEAEIIAQEKEQ